MSIEILRPNATGSENNIASQGAGDDAPNNHYLNVDEVVPDDAGTYNVCASLTTQRDLYGLPNSAIGTGTINKVTLYVRGIIDGVGGAYFRGALKSGATTVETASFTDSGAWTTNATDYTTDPNTGVAWTWAAIDALEAGCVSNFGGTGYGYITQVYVEVDYTVITTAIKTINGLAVGSVKTVNGLPIASVKTVNGLA